MKIYNLNQPFEDMLEWYFLLAESEMGMQSNYAAMIAASLTPPNRSQYQDPYTEAILQATKKQRPIEKAFNKLSKLHQKALYVVLSHVRLHPYVPKILGAKAGIAYLLLPPDDLEKLATKAITMKLDQSDRLKLSEIRNKIRTIYAQAIQEFKTHYENNL